MNVYHDGNRFGNSSNRYVLYSKTNNNFCLLRLNLNKNRITNNLNGQYGPEHAAFYRTGNWYIITARTTLKGNIFYTNDFIKFDGNDSCRLDSIETRCTHIFMHFARTQIERKVLRKSVTVAAESFTAPPPPEPVEPVTNLPYRR